MENNYKEERFDSFINKTIILASKCYFRKQMNIGNREKSIIDDKNYESYLESIIANGNMSSIIDSFANNLQLNSALNTLSDIEQSVIFLLFNEDLSQEDAEKILEVCSKSVSRIKLRALNKIKKYLKEENENEK